MEKWVTHSHDKETQCPAFPSHEGLPLNTEKLATRGMSCCSNFHGVISIHLFLALWKRSCVAGHDLPRSQQICSQQNKRTTVSRTAAMLLPHVASSSQKLTAHLQLDSAPHFLQRSVTTHVLLAALC